MRKDPEDPTSVSDVDEPNLELPLEEEARVPRNCKKRKSGEERNPSDAQGRKTSQTSPDSSSGKQESEERTNPPDKTPSLFVSIGSVVNSHERKENQ